MTKADTVHIYCDGACSGNPGPGGWGSVIRGGGGEYEGAGYAPATTNNQMEMMAVIAAFEYLEGCLPASSPPKITVVTDSQYVVKGITEWIKGWLKKGWRNSAGQQVANQELWERIKRYDDRFSVTWQWVRGHNGHPENERCDRLAVAAIRKSQGKPFAVVETTGRAA